MSTHKKEIIEAILTNSALSTSKKSEVIAQFLEEFNENYPELKYHATKNDVNEVELKLTKEIELIRQETNDIKKDIKIIEKEIQEIKKEIKEETKKLELQIKEFDKRAREDNQKLELQIKEVDKEINHL